MGGSDKNNLTLKVLEVIDKIPKITTVYIVLGDSYKYLSSLNKFKNPKYQIFQNINAEKMSYLMKSSDIGITSSSTVLYEMLMLRMKVFCGYYVDNQKRVYDEFLRKKLILPLGNLLGDFESNLFDGLINFNNLELIISDDFDQQNQKRIKQIILKLL